MLTVDQVLLIHRKYCGGSPEIDRGKLEGALAAPFHTWDGADLHPTLAQKAAKLIAAVAVAHAFEDGNKRLGWMCGIVFLRVNGFDLDADQEEAANLVVDVVTGDMTDAGLALWINIRTSAV